ncbi:paraquat-inducible protein A [Mesorhizobium ephedrae]|uniref:Paraquat-inducible protein A n=1 Tax=Kumtagia ephedrae TaxID=2116701 RepID=A0A2P7RPI5_9HYPH|nr:paraquat-inducible protein A [Mesorhizobium ephedrae]
MPFLLPLILFFATVFFALGVVMPLIRVDRLYFFTDEPSLIGIFTGLWNQGDVLLAALVALFSLVFPALKLMLLHLAAYASPHAPRIPAWFGALANWSMLDVVLVALVVFAAKTSGLATAFTKPGLWFFAASVVLTAIASAQIKRAPANR